ncbi:hypothetical protein Tco_0164276 [Tanacetum coccineum]
MQKPELRPIKDFEAKYNKIKAKLTLLSSSASPSKSTMVKNKVKVLITLAEDNDAVSKEGARNGEWVKISMRKVHTLLEMEDNDNRKTYLDYLIPPPESQTNTIEPPVVVTVSSATDYDSADESLVCSTPLPPLEKLRG